MNIPLICPDSYKSSSHFLAILASQEDIHHVKTIIQDAIDDINCSPTVQILEVVKEDKRLICYLSIEAVACQQLKVKSKEAGNCDIEESNSNFHRLILKIDLIRQFLLDKAEEMPSYIDLRIKSIHLSHTKVTGQAVTKFCHFNKEHYLNGILGSLEEIRFNYTNIQRADLIDFYSFSNLKSLYLDHCYALNSLDDLSSTVYSYSIEKLSLIHTHFKQDTNWLAHIEKRFPNVKVIDLSHMDFSYFSLTDDVWFDSIINPKVAVPCGHVIGQAIAIENFKKNACHMCRSPIKEYFSARFVASRLEKIEECWVAKLLDFKRKPIEDSQLYFHAECGSLFTIDTIKELTDIAGLPTKESVQIDKISNKMFCPGCSSKSPFDITLIFITLTSVKEQQERGIKSLEEIQEHFKASMNQEEWHPVRVNCVLF